MPSDENTPEVPQRMVMASPVALWAAAGVLLVLAWQAMTVQANYGGNWTGLFRTGGAASVPAHLEAGTQRSAHRSGYDGQFYRLLAHDPFLRHGIEQHLDSPALRARRILVPLAAWLLAAGRQQAIDAAYIAVILGFIFGGVYWTGRLLASRGLPAVCGLLFLAVPATIVGADTMTVDVVLAALMACFAWQLATGRERGIWLTLAAAGLVRETGLLLGAAWVLAALPSRQWRKVCLRATVALPALAWFGYVQAVLPSAASLPQWVEESTGWGYLGGLLHPSRYAALGSLAPAVQLLDRLSLLGMGAAVALAAWRLKTTGPAVLKVALALHIGLFLVMTNSYFWVPVYGYSRPFGPLFVLLLMPAGEGSPWRWLGWALPAFALVDLRISAEMSTQVFGVLHWAGLF